MMADPRYSRGSPTVTVTVVLWDSVPLEAVTVIV